MISSVSLANVKVIPESELDGPKGELVEDLHQEIGRLFLTPY